jgi:hypothetical protein
MLGFSPKLPVTPEERQWVDDGFIRLEKLLGRRRMLEAKVVLPIADDFPDQYEENASGAERLFRRVCLYMGVDYRQVQFEVFPDETEELQKILPSWSGNPGKMAAGLYFHGDIGESEAQKINPEEGRMMIAIRSTQLKDPLVLVATVAHELGHAILLGRGLMNRETADHEPMTDLLTVFLGLGIFSANSAARFKQFQDDRRQGWSMQRLGYLPEEVYGYALARFARERGEEKALWAKYLSTNVRAYFRRSHAWLVKNNHPATM